MGRVVKVESSAEVEMSTTLEFKVAPNAAVEKEKYLQQGTSP